MASVLNSAALSPDVLTLIRDAASEVPADVVATLLDLADTVSPIIVSASGIPMAHPNLYLRNRCAAKLEFGTGRILKKNSRKGYADDLCYMLNTYQEASPYIFDKQATYANLQREYSDHLRAINTGLRRSTIARREMIAAEYLAFLRSEIDGKTSATASIHAALTAAMPPSEFASYFQTKNTPTNRRRSPTLIYILPPDVLRQFIRGFSDPAHRLVAQIIFATGLRRFEIAEITPKKVLDLEPIYPGGPALMEVVGKGGKRRNIELEPIIQDLLKNYINSNDRLRRLRKLPVGDRAGASLFLNRFGFPLSGNAIGDAFFIASLRSGIKRTPHELRHEFAAHYLMNAYAALTESIPLDQWLMRLRIGSSDGIIDRLSKLLGHADPETTRKTYLNSLISADPAVRNAWNARLDAMLAA